MSGTRAQVHGKTAFFSLHAGGVPFEMCNISNAKCSKKILLSGMCRFGLRHAPVRDKRISIATCTARICRQIIAVKCKSAAFARRKRAFHVSTTLEQFQSEIALVAA
ncbi:MAG: hypothetical protein U0M13_06530 [Desulfovibrio fairfieldensis]|nr:hypothetical protein [Desulfovibrio fairfieldensis]